MLFQFEQKQNNQSSKGRQVSEEGASRTIEKQPERKNVASTRSESKLSFRSNREISRPFLGFFFLRRQVPIWNLFPLDANNGCNKAKNGLKAHFFAPASFLPESERELVVTNAKFAPFQRSSGPDRGHDFEVSLVSPKVFHLLSFN